MFPSRLASTLLVLAFAFALLGLGGCRCGEEPEQSVGLVDAPTDVPLTIRARSSAPSRSLVVASAAALEQLDLSQIEVLDLAMSEIDSDERPLDILPRPQAPAESETGSPTPTRPGLEHPRCEGLDLHALARRAPALRSLRISGCQAAVHAGLSAFGERLRELELVDLELDAVTIARLSQLHGLEALSLTRVRAEPDALKPLGRKISPQSLTLRELEKDSPVAQIFGVLRDIREIRIVGSWPTHKTMISLAKARKLERLAMIDTGIGNYSLRLLQPLDQLTRIEWRGTGLNGMTAIYLKELPITELVCDCPRFGDSAMRQLYLFEGLRLLSLNRSAISSAGLIHLAPLHALEELTIRYVDLDAEGFAALATLPLLRRLVLGPAALLDPSASSLGELTHLRELEIDLAGFGDSAAPQLETLIELQRLDLSGSEISDAGLAYLAPLTQLRELKLHHTRVTKQGLQHLSAMEKLELLELDHTDLVDAGVAYLAPLHALRELRLDHTLITDAALPYLSELNELERLNLGDTVVSAGGVAQLSELPKLQAVNLSGTRAMDQ